LKNCRKVKSLVEYSEVQNVSDTSFGDGFEKGELAKAIKIAKGMLAEKLPVDLIVKLTGLSLSEIEKLASPLLNDEEKLR
jgi:hypothetical protein